MNYYSLSDYLKDTFGRKLYKISIDGGMTCPNRDGTIGYGGCIFCDGGSGDFAQSSSLSVSEQIENGKLLIEKKFPKRTALSVAGEDTFGDYIAYFQVHTNTYAPVTRLRDLYMEAINHPDIAVMSVATRPDCLSDEIIALLKECNEIKPVWVELGLQTIHETTAEYIRRGYKIGVYDDAVRRLKSAGISHVITHLIIGLPGESVDMMLESVRHVVALGSDGIKLQLLHVLEGTDLAKDYENGMFECLSLEQYGDIICKCLELLPEGMVVHRITGDGNKRRLIAPLWSGDKKRVMNYLNGLRR